MSQSSANAALWCELVSPVQEFRKEKNTCDLTANKLVDRESENAGAGLR